MSNKLLADADAEGDADGSLPMPSGMRAEYLTDDLVVLSFPLAEVGMSEALSSAEQEVALLVCAGASSKQIAAARGVSPKTIGNQLESIYRKLGVGSRSELVLYLRAHRHR